MKKIIRNIRYFIPILFKTNPFMIFSLIIIAILRSANNFCWIIFPKLIIEELMGARDQDKLIIIVLSFAAITAILKIIISLLDKINNYYTVKADFEIDKMINQKITTIDYFHIEDPEFADKLSIAQKGLNQYSSGIYSFAWTIESVLTSIITISSVIGIVLFSKEIWVVVITLISVVINALIYGRLQSIHEEYNRNCVRFNRRQWYYNQSMMSFRLQKNIRLYDAKQLIEDKSKEENKIAFNLQKKVSYKLANFGLVSNFFDYFLNNAPIIIILAYSVYYHNSTIAIFTMLYSAVNTLHNMSISLVYDLKRYNQDCKYQEDFINLMEMESVFKDGKTPIKDIQTVEFKNVSFKYPRTDNYVLKDINLFITNKEKISLVGLNGSGKTTLIKLLCRFFEVKEGEILVNGINIKEYIYEDYMKCISVVFQDFKIISFSVKENIAILDNNQDKLYDTLRRAQVLDKILSLPNKENTYVNKWFDKTGVEFSGGELQKFALARSLYKESDLVILDEPTSALDPLAESEIYYHFNDVVGKKLCLFISHRLSSCIFSDRILVLDGAKIIECGTHKELLSNKEGLYYKMFTSQAAYYQ